MTRPELLSAVECGSCTWLQVHETLINAGTTHHTRRLFLDGEIELGAPVVAMLDRLVETGSVPLFHSSLAEGA